MRRVVAGEYRHGDMHQTLVRIGTVHEESSSGSALLVPRHHHLHLAAANRG
jgi:hypothetical protein